jgi:hypothetical protein
MSQEPGSVLVMWVFYQNPRDYPGKLVVRRGCATQHGWMGDVFPAIISPSTARNRRLIQEFMVFGYLHWMARDPQDDPVILGCWI